MEATSGDPRPPSDAPDVRIIAWRPSGTTETVDVAGAGRDPRRTRHEGLGRRHRSVRRACQADRRGPRPPPAHRRGHRRAQPAGQGRDLRRRRPHRALRAQLRRRCPDCRNRLRPRAAVPPERPRPGVRSAIDRADAGGRRADPEEGHRLPPLRPRRSRRRRLLPGARPPGRGDRRAPGPGPRIADPIGRSSASSS